MPLHYLYPYSAQKCFMADDARLAWRNFTHFEMARQVVQKSGCVAVLHIARPDIAARFNGDFKIPSGMISICDHRKLRAMVDTSKGPKAPVKATLITVDSPSYRGYAYASGETYFRVEIFCLYCIDIFYFNWFWVYLIQKGDKYPERNVLVGNRARYLGTCIFSMGTWVHVPSKMPL